MKLSNDRYEFILGYVWGMALDAVWLYLEDEAKEYKDRKELFLWFLRRMLAGGVIVLAKNGKKLISTPDAAARMFEQAFPSEEINLDNGVWFFTEDCPAGIGWVAADGSIDWV